MLAHIKFTFPIFIALFELIQCRNSSTFENTTEFNVAPAVTKSLSQILGNGSLNEIHIPTYILKSLRKSLRSKYKGSANSTKKLKAKGEKAKDEKEEEEDEEIPEGLLEDYEPLTEDQKSGLVPLVEEHDGLMDRFRKVGPPVLNIITGAIKGNQTAMRDLWLLLAYEASYLFP